MKQEIRYILMDPTGNRTVLVETGVPVSRQPQIAQQLLRLEPTAEQVGFLGQAASCDTALRMAGGEFCGNAAMSAAARYAMQTGQARCTVRVQISGAKAPIAVRIEQSDEKRWQGAVEMPQPLSIEEVRFSDGRTLPVVFLPGIAHVIMDSAPDADAPKLAKSRCAELHADALGMMFLDRCAQTLTPLVYVPSGDTLFWEHSCGSGTSAVGAYLAAQANEALTIPFRQPGGTLEVYAEPGGTLRLRGTTALVHERTAVIETEL